MLYLTAQERKVIIFVLCLLFLGLGLDFVKKKINQEDIINYKSLEKELFKKVDINKANFSEFRSIPGVGENLAQRIVDYRRACGQFENIEQLKNVRGIKDKKLKQIKKYITIMKK